MHRTVHHFERLPHVGTTPASVRDRAVEPVRKHPLVGLIRNPRSHRNGGDESAPAGSWPNVLVHTPARREDISEILAQFAEAQVDYIAVDGGDGTVRDVLTCGAGVFGESWPVLIVLPRGKTNALALDLGISTDWTLDEALSAVRRGRIATRRPLMVMQRDNERAQVSGFVLGGGAFTRAIGLGQSAHNLGAFDAAVVGLTAMWSVLQALFGGRDNPWRRGTRMRLRAADGSDLPHRGGGPAYERYLVFASTLRSLPAGLKPFGAVGGRLRLAVLDNARRSLLLRLPLIFVGRAGAGTQRLGLHLIGTDEIDLDIDDRFIIDGEAFPAGSYRLKAGPKLRFVVP